MAKVLCHMADCKHRSKRASKLYKTKDGRQMYGCVLDVIVVRKITDCDGDCEALIDKENMAQCMYYEPIGN